MAGYVLVVEDDLEMVALLKLMLSRRGFEVRAAINGEQALEQARTDPPVLVLLDVMLPDLDGYEVCRRLRKDPRTAGVPVVMLSARAHAQYQVAGLEAGADVYLTKPVAMDNLVAQIHELVNHRAA